MSRRSLLLLAVVLIIPMVLSAQDQPLAPDQQLPQDIDQAIGAAVDITSSLRLSASDLVNTGSTTTLTFGYWLLAAIGAWEFVKSIRMALAMLANSWHPHFGYFVTLPVTIIFKVLIVRVFLDHYMVPFSGVGINFHQILPYLAQALCNSINQAALRDMLRDISFVAQYLQVPVNPLNVLANAAYMCVLLLFGVIQFGVVVITAAGYVLVAIYSFFGPMLLPFYVSTRYERLFWDWVDGMLGYSMYPVIGTAISVIFSGMFLNFFNHTLNGDYSIGSFIANLPYLLLLTLAFIWTMFLTPAISSRLFGGKADLGQGFSNAMMGGLQMGVARLLR